MESIIKSGKYCFFCGRTDRLEKHHALHGTANRRKADALGLWVWLCPECHRGTYGVHGKHGHDRDMAVKMAAEFAYLSAGHSMDDWMREFQKNYL